MPAFTSGIPIEYHRERFQLRPDGVLIHQWENADRSWTQWRPLGDRRLSQFEIGTGAKGELYVFGVGKDDRQVWTVHQDSGGSGDEVGWNKWENWGGEDAVKVGWGSYKGQPTFEYVNVSGRHFYRTHKNWGLDYLGPEWGAYTPDPPYREPEIGAAPDRDPEQPGNGFRFPKFPSGFGRLARDLREKAESESDAELWGGRTGRAVGAPPEPEPPEMELDLP